MMSASYYDVTKLAPVVPTTSGKVQGRWQNACSAAYLGVPFAAPPIDDLRFEAPRPPAQWQGIRPALEYGPTPQRSPFGPVTTIPEPSISGDSTLNVNIFTPAPRDRRAHLPVLVWIHGGGYFAGSPSSPWYNGRGFNADGIVTVSVSYRLGFQGFGWLEDAPLNRGLLDQIAALQWVQENIEGFGGDPSRVTIAGQSAGGGCALSLLASAKAKGLFRGVIGQSSAFHNLQVEQIEQVGRALAQQVGIEPTKAAWAKVDEAVIIAKERDVNFVEGIPSTLRSGNELLQSVKKGLIGYSNLAYAPTVDGEVLQESVKEACQHGAGANVSLFMGSARNEFSYPVLEGEALCDIVSEFATAGLSHEAVSQYSSDVCRIGEDRALGQLLSTYMFHIGLIDIARIRSSTDAGVHTWLYDYAQESSISNASMHCEDVPYAFNVLDAPGVENVLGYHPSQRLADDIHGLWVNFIATGRLDQPTAKEHPHGAIRFVGNVCYDPEAYRFASELLDRAKA